MKTTVLLLLAFISSTVFADYKSEVKAIEKFEVEEFVKPENYPPRKPGELPDINKKFYDRLMGDQVAIKYFVLLTTAYRLVETYKKDKGFALSLESKFGGKKLDKDMWEKVFAYVGDPILKESNAEHKKTVSNRAVAEAHFQKSLASLNSASFK